MRLNRRTKDSGSLRSSGWVGIQRLSKRTRYRYRYHDRSDKPEARGPTQAEPGCVIMGAFRATGDPRLFHVHSRWHDEAAFERHATMPHTVRFIETVEGLVDQPIGVTRAEAIG
ncbi:MAG TPA: antibiotic biosynthesis monooxygenase [Stellaceae bacterium]|nr:antibiotic biosynthesis monooxygenase [Stellaceae bacterium]